MFYIIKAPHDSCGPYVAVESNNESFSYEKRIEDATRFNSVSDAIAAIVRRDWWFGYPTDTEFTLAKVENVGVPVYKETEL